MLHMTQSGGKEVNASSKISNTLGGLKPFRPRWIISWNIEDIGNKMAQQRNDDVIMKQTLDIWRKMMHNILIVLVL